MTRPARGHLRPARLAVAQKQHSQPLIRARSARTVAHLAITLPRSLAHRSPFLVLRFALGAPPCELGASRAGIHPDRIGVPGVDTPLLRPRSHVSRVAPTRSIASACGCATEFVTPGDQRLMRSDRTLPLCSLLQTARTATQFRAKISKHGGFLMVRRSCRPTPARTGTIRDDPHDAQGFHRVAAPAPAPPTRPPPRPSPASARTSPHQPTPLKGPRLTHACQPPQRSDHACAQYRCDTKQDPCTPARHREHLPR